MSWVKLDDQFFLHPKIIAAGRDARDLYLAALTYTAGQLTDGYVPNGALPLIAAMAGVAGVDSLAEHLVDVRLWEEVDGGYEIHDYHDYNPSSDQVRSMREARAEAGRRGGLNSAASKLEANSQANAQANEQQTSTPSPSPSPSPSPDPVPVPAGVGAIPQTEPAPAAEPPPTRRHNRRSDPRSRHPAIIAARGATGARKYPPLELYDGLIQAIGEEPDVGRLQRCRQAWVERGYNPGAWTWATEWYVGGIPAKGPRGSPGGNGNGRLTGEAAREAFLRRHSGEP